MGWIISSSFSFSSIVILLELDENEWRELIFLGRKDLRLEKSGEWSIEKRKFDSASNKKQDNSKSNFPFYSIGLHSFIHSRIIMRLFLRVFSLGKCFFLLLFGYPIFCQFFGKKEGPILAGQTPCCFDRLGGLLCGRQKKANLGAFLHKCMQNADFAFVQCCLTCFAQDENDPFKLDYKKTSEFLLTNPQTAKCWDRRGQNWCEKFAWGYLEENKNVEDWSRKGRGNKMECENVPIAFRICRKTCGFCGTEDSPAKAVYEEKVAKSFVECYNPARGMAREGTDLNLEENSVFRNFVNRYATRRRKMKKRRREMAEKEFGIKIKPNFMINE